MTDYTPGAEGPFRNDVAELLGKHHGKIEPEDALNAVYLILINAFRKDWTQSGRWKAFHAMRNAILKSL